MLTFRTVIAALTFATLSAGALAQEVTVMISGGFKAALEKLAPQYEAQSGDRLIVVSGPSMGKTPQAIPARLARGEKADVLIMVGDALAKLEQDRRTAAGSRVELADSPVGMVVKAGAPVPDISTVPALRQTLLKAGVTFVGKLPDDMQYITRFAGAVTQKADHPEQGKALLAFLSSPQAASVITATGLTPVSAPRDTAR